MKPDNPLQIVKAIPRYAAVPVQRWSGRGKPRALYVGPRHRWGEVLEAYPDRRMVFRSPYMSAFEFQMSLAPWILSDRRAIVIGDEPLPAFVERFCQDRGVPLIALEPPAPVEDPAPPPESVTAPKPKKEAEPRIPKWFRRHVGPELSRDLSRGLPTFLYMPWIPEHGDTLIGRIGGAGYVLAPFDLIKDIDENEVRREALRYAREHPDLYRRMVVRRLVPIRNRISGFILTFDWAPVMRIIVEVCKELRIPTILIPHESVFVDRNLYYTDITSKASVPLCDVVLGWGEMQRSIFLERGYPAERFISVGAPKFDTYFDYQPRLDRHAFHRLYGLDGDKKTILFASQPLDSQTDMRLARASQRRAIKDLLDYAIARDAQLIVRLPPSKDDIVGRDLTEEMKASGLAAIDDAECYLVDPEEAVHHADIVTSVNSTMLFEGALSGRPALSMKYIEFSQIWEQAGIPAARSDDEARPILDLAFGGEWIADAKGLEWAANQFGVGQFDGEAATRIAHYLHDHAVNKSVKIETETASERVFSKKSIDVFGIPSHETVLSSSQKYLIQLMNARTLVDGAQGMDGLQNISGAEVFLKWGIKETVNKARQDDAARALGKPVLIVEDGFIRSVDIGLSGEPGLSILLDDTTAYYDASKPSRMERRLQHGPDLTPVETARAKAAIARIVAARVSKYNHAPDRRIPVGSPDRPKVLLVDQRFEDQSVLSGMADETSFDRMILDVLESRPGHDVIVKQHPDAIKGGKSSYFSNERLARFSGVSKHIYPIAFDINPFALFDMVEEVYVATSGMGFEALMAGKTVHCYGAPYYSGWGVTQDRIKLPRRTRARSVEDIFHFAYIELSRYYDPEKGHTVEVEEVVDYIASRRKA